MFTLFIEARFCNCLYKRLEFRKILYSACLLKYLWTTYNPIFMIFIINKLVGFSLMGNKGKKMQVLLFYC